MAKPISLIFLTLILAGCLSSPDNSKPKEIKNSIYYQYDAKFSLSLPPAWDSKLDQKFGDMLIDLVSKNTPRENFSANVTVIISHHSGTSDIPKVINMIKEDASQSMPGISFLSDTVFVKNGVTLGTMLYQGNYIGIDLKFKQLVFVRNNLDIQIEFTDLEKYFDANTEFTDIENSLSFL